jgi:DNA-binding NarL/FixJ family response regulator
VPDGIVVAVDEDEGLLQLRLLHRAFPDAPIVVAASEGDLLSVRRAIVCGAGDYLLRPTASELLEALSRLLEGDDGELGRKAA